ISSVGFWATLGFSGAGAFCSPIFSAKTASNSVKASSLPGIARVLRATLPHRMRSSPESVLSLGMEVALRCRPGDEDMEGCGIAHMAGQRACSIARAGENIAARRADDRRARIERQHQAAKRL